MKERANRGVFEVLFGDVKMIPQSQIEAKNEERPEDDDKDDNRSD